MKSLNRTLSLVLVFALVFSLMTMAFAADTTATTPTTTPTTQANVTYTDAASIIYKEAVGVTSAIGVFQGDNNTFNPKSELTREQAAKIICYMTIGKAAADSLKVPVAPYSDVAADRWSAGAIAYCQSQGIVSGYGDNRFGPTDKVTGFQFAKMLLVALNYDANIEGFNGASWSLNVAKRGFENNLFKDNATFNGNNAATREEASLYTFNTLKAVPVYYENKGTTITSKDGTKIVTGATAAQHIYNPTKTYFEVHFPALKTVDSSNVLGQPTANWSFNDLPVNTYTAKKAVVTYTASSTLAKVGTDLKGYTFADSAHSTRYINGHATAIAFTAASIAALTGNGKTVEVYADVNSQINRVVVVNTVLAKVAAVDSTTSKITYSIPAADGFCTSAGSTISAVGYGTYKVGDYVAATFVATGDTLSVTAGQIDNAQLVSVVAPTVVTGKAIAKSNTTDTKTITLAGKVYTASANIVTDKNVGAFTIDENHDATLMLDPNGYILSAKAGVAKTNETVGMITKAYGKVAADGTYAPVIDVVRSDGTTVSVPVTTAQTGNEGKTVVLTPSVANVGAYNVALTTATNGVAIDPAVMYISENFQTLTKSVSKADKQYSATYLAPKTFYYSSDVKFIYYNATTKVATVLNGVQAIPQANYTVTFALYDTDSTTVDPAQADYVITAAFVVANAPSTAATTKDILFANGQTTSIAKQNNIPLYTNVVYNEGAKVDGGAMTPLAQFSEGFYYATQDANKLYSAANVFTTDGAISADNGGINLASIKNDSAIVVNGHTYKLADSTKYVGVNVGAIATVSDLDSLNAYLKTASAKAWVLYNNETNTVLYVYVDVISNNATLTAVTATGYVWTIDETAKTIKATKAGTPVANLAGENLVKGNISFTTAAGATGVATYAGANVADGDTVVVTAADGLTTATYTFKNA